MMSINALTFSPGNLSLTSRILQPLRNWTRPNTNFEINHDCYMREKFNSAPVLVLYKAAELNLFLLRSWLTILTTLWICAIVDCWFVKANWCEGKIKICVCCYTSVTLWQHWQRYGNHRDGRIQKELLIVQKKYA